MLSCDDFFIYLKSKLNNLDIQKYYCGKLDRKHDKSILLYDVKDNSLNKAIGGKECTKTNMRHFSILVHYTMNFKDTENISNEIYDILEECKDVIGNNGVNYKINYVNILCDSPINIGFDENGICERIIDFRVYYNKQF